MIFKLANSLKDINDIENTEYVAQEKLDGHRAELHYKDGINRFFSRRINKKGVNEENTDKVPYLRDLDLGFEGETILDGELILKGSHSDSNLVQKVLGSTAERATELYKNNVELEYRVFDILLYNGQPQYNKTYLERLSLLQSLKNLNIVKTYTNSPKYEHLFQRVTSYKELFDKVTKNGGEGIMLKKLDSRYDNKRNDDWLKVKTEYTVDLVIMGFTEPKKEYKGKFSIKELKERDYPYFKGYEPVNRSYFLGFKESFILGAYNEKGELRKICTCKVKNDEEQEQIKNGDIQIGDVVEVSHNGVLNKNKLSLRHPRIKCIRKDKNAIDCIL